MRTSMREGDSIVVPRQPKSDPRSPCVISVRVPARGLADHRITSAMPVPIWLTDGVAAMQ